MKPSWRFFLLGVGLNPLVVALILTLQIHDPLNFVSWSVLLAVLAADFRHKRFGRTLSLAGGLLTSFGLIIMSLMWPVLFDDYSHRREFDSQNWRNSSERNAEPIKLRMVDDLLSRYRLVGMTRKQIDDLLGQPPHTEYFKDYDYVYWLGPERSFFSIDSEWLCIKFKNDLAIEADICRD
jgi:hypothetical protein